MCIVAAKYFPGVGWVGVKNRDRNYVPELSFRRTDTSGGVEKLMYEDAMTGYREGLNGNGVCVLSSSLRVIDDEKEIKKETTKHSGDGERIGKALGEPTLEKVVKSCIASRLTGNTLIFDRDRMFLLEACTKPCTEEATEDDEYVYELKEIPKTEAVARTNHGIALDWAGYQAGGREGEALSRRSSESRLRIARRVLGRAKEPTAILDLLCVRYSQDPQMNALRTATDRKKMRTTAQIMLIPSERTMYVRPVQSSIDFNFWKMDDPEADTWVEILSNRPLWQNHKKGANGSVRMRHKA